MADGIRELDEILANLDVKARNEPYVFLTTESAGSDADTLVTRAARTGAVVVEDEATTLVIPAAEARSGEPEFAWLTLTVHSSLESVGLTAVFSTALAEHGISCNVIAGYHHDHVLVPAARKDEALRVLRSIRGLP